MSAEAVVVILSVILIAGSLTVLFFLCTEITPSELPQWSRAKRDWMGQQRRQASLTMSEWGKLLFARSKEALTWAIDLLKPAIGSYVGTALPKTIRAVRRRAWSLS